MYPIILGRAARTCEIDTLKVSLKFVQPVSNMQIDCGIDGWQRHLIHELQALLCADVAGTKLLIELLEAHDDAVIKANQEKLPNFLAFRAYTYVENLTCEDGGVIMYQAGPRTRGMCDSVFSRVLGIRLPSLVDASVQQGQFSVERLKYVFF